MRKLISFLYALKYYIYNSIITDVPSYKFRRLYLVRILKYSIDPTASVHMGCFFTGSKFKMEAHSVVNRNCHLDCRSGVYIQRNVSVSPECYIISAGHDPQSPDFSGQNGPIVMEDYAWLGARCIVLPGIKICEGVVVGAGSTVVKSFPAYSIIAGNPARFIKERQRELKYIINWFPWFNTDVV